MEFGQLQDGEQTVGCEKQIEGNLISDNSLIVDQDVPKVDDSKSCQKSEVEEKEEEGGCIDPPEMEPLQLDKDLKEWVLQQLVPVALQHLDIGGACICFIF